MALDLVVRIIGGVCGGVVGAHVSGKIYGYIYPKPQLEPPKNVRLVKDDGRGDIIPTRKPETEIEVNNDSRNDSRDNMYENYLTVMASITR
jgi:hypothetical protein